MGTFTNKTVVVVGAGEGRKETRAQLDAERLEAGAGMALCTWSEVAEDWWGEWSSIKSDAPRKPHCSPAERGGHSLSPLENRHLVR